MPATTKEQPGWYTPKRLLALFCVQLLLTWLDLGIFASNYVTGDDDSGQPQGVKAEFGLSGFQLGLLPALYAVGLVVAGFGFAAAARRANALRLMGLGMAVWAAGAALTGAARSYGALVVARTLALLQL
eukprot:XP_001700333.1 predicted protein [Chlamydomonas reinhardtii]